MKPTSCTHISENGERVGIISQLTSVEIILKEFVLKQIVGVYIYNQLDGNDCIKKIKS